MTSNYDVIILGCGEAGIFAAYELAHLRPELKVLALDQGQDISHRSLSLIHISCLWACTRPFCPSSSR